MEKDFVNDKEMKTVTTSSVGTGKNSGAGKPSQKTSDNSHLRKVFDFKIAGVSYKIKSSHDEETVQSLVRYVDQKVSDAMKATKNSSFQNAAVLAALNIAEEYILLKKKALKELTELEEKASKLSGKIESSKANKNFI